MLLSTNELQDFLNQSYLRYNNPDFIASDPICIPHFFSKKEDIEIAGFLSATIAWGKRSSIIKSAKKIIHLMDNAPHDFVLNATTNDLKIFKNFKHRTFNSVDTVFFIQTLQRIYQQYQTLENVFIPKDNNAKCQSAILHFREQFFTIPHPQRTQKHISNPAKNSSAKRICMFLRWMVRKDNKGVDFGIWQNHLSPADLMCPLDVHSGNIARGLGLLSRKQNDWKAVQELTEQLKKMDNSDPVKYDFALFGLGVFKDL